MYVTACVYTTVCLYVAACVYVMASMYVAACVCVTARVMYVHSVYGCLERPDSSTPLSSRNLPRRQRSNLIKARASPELLLGHLAVPGEWGVLLKKNQATFSALLGGRIFPKVPGKGESAGPRGQGGRLSHTSEIVAVKATIRLAHL